MSTETAAKPQTIFDIQADLEQVAQAFDALAESPDSSEADEALKAAVMSYFGDLVQERDRKLDSYAEFVRFQTSMADIRRAEARRIAALAQSAENAAKRAKGLLQHLFETQGWTRQETPRHKFWIQSNGGKPPVEVDDVDPSSLPERFRKVRYELDTDAVRAALEAGETLDFARLGQAGTHLRIK